MSTFDWERDTKGEFDPVPDGEYRVKVEKVEMLKANSGNQMAKYHCRITDIDVGVRGYLFPVVVLTEKAIWRLSAMIKACGVVPTEAQKRCDLGTPEFLQVLKLPVGREFVAIVENKERNGYTNSEVVKFRKMEGSGEVLVKNPDQIPWEE
jgi:hypothetical protein